MNYTIVWTQRARKELYRIYEHYRLRNEGIAAVFLAGIDEKLEVLKQFPERFPFYSGKTRKCVLRKFPYLLYYIYYRQKREIKVTKIMHTSRDHSR